ncbi:MAG: hypothetical protein JWL77_10 [Chthonomonadaceae bacterium]|nr:hypothetical protein [Chthonomonadaceae bacterium]
MKTIKLFALTLLLALLCVQQAAKAQTNTGFNVILNTQELSTHAGNPFSVYCDLTNGSGADNGASVTLDNFNLGTGGPWSGPASVTLTEQAGIFDTSFIQAFNPGDMLSFDVHLFSNGDDSPPDVFTFALQDANGFFLPTTGSDPNNPDGVGADVYLSIPFVNGTTLTDIQAHDAFSGDPANGGINSGQVQINEIPASVTPEGGSMSLMWGGLVGIVLVGLRRRRSANL